MLTTQNNSAVVQPPQLLDISNINFDDLKKEDLTLYDTSGRNILHYACCELNIDKINKVLAAAKSFNVVDECVNHRSTDGTNPLGAVQK